MKDDGNKTTTTQADRIRETPRKPSGDETDRRSQSEKFKDLAREVEADEDEQSFDRALRKMREGRPGQRDKDTSETS